MPGGAVAATYAAAPNKKGSGAWLRGKLIQGVRSPQAYRKSVDWTALVDIARDKLVLVHTDNGAAAAFANCCAGRSSELTKVARCIKELGLAIP